MELKKSRKSVVIQIKSAQEKKSRSITLYDTTVTKVYDFILKKLKSRS